MTEIVVVSTLVQVYIPGLELRFESRKISDDSNEPGTLKTNEVPGHRQPTTHVSGQMSTSMAPCIARFLYTQIDSREHGHVGQAPQRALRARNTGGGPRITAICILTPLGDGFHERVRRRREESQWAAHEGASETKRMPELEHGTVSSQYCRSA